MFPVISLVSLNVKLSRCLYQLQEINDQLSTLSNDTENPPSTSMLRAIQRHREVYLDYARELRRTKVRTVYIVVSTRVVPIMNVGECQDSIRPGELAQRRKK